MKIEILLSGIVIFLICLLIHAVLWRIRYPRHRALTLFLIFLVLPSLVWPLYLLSVFMSGLPGGLGPRLLDGAAILLLHLSLSSAYILSYPAVEAISPTLAIALFMGEFGNSAGHEELARLFPHEAILAPRIMDLVESKLVTLNNDTLTLTIRGRILVLFFIGLRSFIGLKPGRG